MLINQIALLKQYKYIRSLKTNFNSLENIFIRNINSQNSKLVGSVGKPKDLISQLSWKESKEILEIEIPKNTCVNNPIEGVNFPKKDKESTAYVQHMFINALSHSDSTIILKYNHQIALSQNIEINLEQNARLTLISIQNYKNKSQHHSYHYVNLAKNSYLKHIIIDLSTNSMSQFISSVNLQGQEANIDMLGFYCNDDYARTKHKISINHIAPSCRSFVNYKGILMNKTSYSDWVSNIFIAKNAFKTSTYQANKNLLINENAKFISVPNLEIETGNIIQAGHASSTVNFNPEHLFYLQSRGITYKQACQLIIFGFVNEIFDFIDEKKIKKDLLLLLSKKLNKIKK